MKDVRFPKQLVTAMAAEAQASRDACGKVIASEGEHKASRSLRHAAEILSENPIAMQLRYLPTLEGISEENKSTIIFTVLVDGLARVKQHQQDPFL